MAAGCCLASCASSASSTKNRTKLFVSRVLMNCRATSGHGQQAAFRQNPVALVLKMAPCSLPADAIPIALPVGHRPGAMTAGLPKRRCRSKLCRPVAGATFCKGVRSTRRRQVADVQARLSRVGRHQICPAAQSWNGPGPVRRLASHQQHKETPSEPFGIRLHCRRL